MPPSPVTVSGKIQNNRHFEISGRICDGKNIVNIPGDGDCFYTSVYLAYKVAMQDKKQPRWLQDPNALRQCVAQIMRQKYNAAKHIVDVIRGSAAAEAWGIHVDDTAYVNIALETYELLVKTTPQICASLGFQKKDVIASLHFLAALNGGMRGLRRRIKTADQYIRMISKHGEHAGALEQNIAADLLQCQLGVHSLDNTVVQEFPAVPKPGSPRIDIFHEKNHYSSLLDPSVKQSTIRALVQRDSKLTQYKDADGGWPKPVAQRQLVSPRSAPAIPPRLASTTASPAIPPRLASTTALPAIPPRLAATTASPAISPRSAATTASPAIPPRLASPGIPTRSAATTASPGLAALRRQKLMAKAADQVFRGFESFKDKQMPQLKYLYFKNKQDCKGILREINKLLRYLGKPAANIAQRRIPERVVAGKILPASRTMLIAINVAGL